MDDDTLERWFVREILPLEPALMRFIRRNCADSSEIADIRQDIYEKTLQGACGGLPVYPAAYLFTVARNLLIRRAKRSKIISFDIIADLEELPIEIDLLTPERQLSAREELRMVQSGLEKLPPRCREIVSLRRIEGLSTKEVAARTGVTVSAVEQQLNLGMRALVDFMLGGTGRIHRRPKASVSRRPTGSRS